MKRLALKNKLAGLLLWLLRLARSYGWVLLILILNSGLLLATGRFEDGVFGSRYYPSFLGFVYGQFCLLAIWFSLANVAAWIRSLLTISLGIALVFAIPIVGRHADWPEEDQDLLLNSCFVAMLGIGIVLRSFVGPIRRTYQENERTAKQFSILYVMGLTAALAVLVAYVQSRWGLFLAEGSNTNYLQMSLTAVATSVVTTYLLFTRHPFVVSIVAMIFSWSAGLTVLYLIHGKIIFYDNMYIWHFGMIYFSQCLMMLISLWTARLMGYKSRWAIQKPAPSQASTSDPR